MTMSWCFDSYIYICIIIYLRNRHHIYDQIWIESLHFLQIGCISTTHSPVIFWLQKASVTNRFSHMFSPSPSQKCSFLIVGGLSCFWVPIYLFRGKIWIQVSQNGSLVPTSFQLMIFHAWWFSCQEGVEFRGSAASKTSERPDDFWIHVDPSRRVAISRAWGPCRIIENLIENHHEQCIWM